MKQKDLVQLLAALAIFIVAGYLIYAQVGPKKSKTAKQPMTITHVTPLPAGYNQDTISKLTDSAKYQDFYSVPDLSNGVGNSQLFAQ